MLVFCWFCCYWCFFVVRSRLQRVGRACPLPLCAAPSLVWMHRQNLARMDLAQLLVRSMQNNVAQMLDELQLLVRNEAEELLLFGCVDQQHRVDAARRRVWRRRRRVEVHTAELWVCVCVWCEWLDVVLYEQYESARVDLRRPIRWPRPDCPAPRTGWSSHRRISSSWSSGSECSAPPALATAAGSAVWASCWPA